VTEKLRKNSEILSESSFIPTREGDSSELDALTVYGQVMRRVVLPPFTRDDAVKKYPILMNSYVGGQIYLNESYTMPYITYSVFGEEEIYFS